MQCRQTSLTPDAAELLALRALAHVAGDETLGPRLLALTGLDAETLRARAGTREVLGATLDFLAAREADLVACAAALECPAELLAAARAVLSR